MIEDVYYCYYKANVKVKNNNNHTPLEVGTMKTWYLDIVNIYVQHGINIDNLEILVHTASDGLIDILKILLDRGHGCK
ncbi:MAG: hypothetical protein AB8U25_00390 [Rickettsiales endosymbiont of Dermacentor nuttalli]